ncbi:hypothetical protein [Sphingorhabdus contaminans]|uniref:hypothetical protein n=1 Tax=Sphingorhabdus contaminans TaxID=1343899 RepID=UPI003D2CF785
MPVSNCLHKAALWLAACAAAVGIVTPSTAATGQKSWTGIWEGNLQNFPVRAAAPVVSVRREIGAWPQKDGECAAFRTIYSEGGVEKGRKDYKLCRTADANDYVVDEGGGVTLKARMLDDTLVSTFKYGSILLVSVIRVRGKEMTEEIFTAADQPANDAVVTMDTRSMQRLTLRRVRK